MRYNSEHLQAYSVYQRGRFKLELLLRYTVERIAIQKVTWKTLVFDSSMHQWVEQEKSFHLMCQLLYSQEPYLRSGTSGRAEAFQLFSTNEGTFPTDKSLLSHDCFR